MLLNKHLSIVLVLIISVLNFCSSQAIRKNKPTPYHEWDYIMFSQRWPITGCAQWEEAKKDNTCNMPNDSSLWTVHGVWPTKTGTDGPLFCPSAIHFDPDQLEPIMDDLKTYWINIEANTKLNSFWKHEWEKHGTCASTLPELDSVRNYFQQALEWNKLYKISDILDKSKIIPGNEGYTVEQIQDAVMAVTNKIPSIQCVVDKQTKETMISEIRICLNKSFELIDCDQSSQISRNKLGIITNCSLKKPIMYLAKVPIDGISYEMDYVDDAFKQHFEEQMYYMKVYRFLKFLLWFTT